MGEEFIGPDQISSEAGSDNQPIVPEGSEQGQEAQVQSQPPVQTEEETIATLRAKLNAEQAKTRFYQSLSSKEPEPQHYQQPVQPQTPPQFYQPQPADPFSAFGDEDILTGAQAKQLVSSMVGASIEQYRSAEQETQRANQCKVDEALARAQYSDFDEVIEYAADLVKNDQRLLQQLSTAENIAVAAYFLGKSHPTYEKNQATKFAQNISQQINKGIKAPATLSQGGGTGNLGATSLDKVKAMKSADIEAVLERARRGETITL